MMLNIHLDTAYLDLPQAKSHDKGHFFLGWLPQDKQPIELNKPIHV